MKPFLQNTVPVDIFKCQQHIFTDSLATESDGFTLLDINQNPANAGTEGLLLYNGGTVCDDAFTDYSADVACKELGFR